MTQLGRVVTPHVWTRPEPTSDAATVASQRPAIVRPIGGHTDFRSAAVRAQERIAAQAALTAGTLPQTVLFEIFEQVTVMERTLEQLGCTEQSDHAVRRAFAKSAWADFAQRVSATINHAQRRSKPATVKTVPEALLFNLQRLDLESLLANTNRKHLLSDIPKARCDEHRAHQPALTWPAVPSVAQLRRQLPLLERILGENPWTAPPVDQRTTRSGAAIIGTLLLASPEREHAVRLGLVLKDPGEFALTYLTEILLHDQHFGAWAHVSNAQFLDTTREAAFILELVACDFLRNPRATRITIGNLRDMAALLRALPVTERERLHDMIYDSSDAITRGLVRWAHRPQQHVGHVRRWLADRICTAWTELRQRAAYFIGATIVDLRTRYTPADSDIS